MRVAFLTKDLLFTSRVTSVTTRRSIELLVIATADELIERASRVPIKVILLDLSTSGLDPAQLVPQLQKLSPPPSAIIAFGPHVHESKLAAARDAGCDQVLSRGEFNHRMDEILADFLHDTNEPDDSFSREMEQALGDLVSFQEVIRGIHATDASHYQIMPRCVVTPRDEADLVQAVTIAAKYKVPTTARGGGTSLSGQTHGPGMILDLSRHMNRILKIHPQEGWAQVQPGVVRDHLNAAVAEFGLQYAPDPATTSRATVGGMIGNNSAGTRSIVYGKSSDHLLSTRVVLADGRIVDFEDCVFSEWASTSAEALLRGLKEIVDAHADAIRTKFPKVMRRVSGYALDAFLDDPVATPWNLSRLFCGSEGTLGILVEAKVKLVPLPKATAVVAVHFEEVLDSLRHLEPMLEHGPSTIELLDHTVLREAQTNASTRDIADFVEGSPDAMQLVEFMGEDRADADRKAHAFVNDMKSRGAGYAWPLFSDAAGQAKVWDVRRLGLGLITNVKGSTKGQAFVEDACIPHQHLPTYIERLQAKCREESVQLTLYAHASVGVLHARPALDLHQQEDIAKMKRIATYAFEMCMEYGGAWAGEHGDGIVRGEFIQKFFGPEVYAAFREVKRLFDPENLMNPGKLIDPPPMTSHLRYQQEGYAENTRKTETGALFQFRDQGGLTLAVEQCNGVGACRNLGVGVMCPSYMATRDEKDTTRARANALRLAISGQLFDGDPDQAMASDEMHEVMKLCLGCKACKSECPNAVDMAKMKAEVLQKRYDIHGTPLGAKIIGLLPVIAHWMTGPWAPLINGVQGSRPMRWMLHQLCHIDSQRPLPRFTRRSLKTQLKQKTMGQGERGEVALYVDSYTNAYEPHVGQAAMKLLAECGFKVTAIFPGDSQRARISKGLVRAARRGGEKLMRQLDAWASRGIPIVCLEPSCASALKDDLPDLLADEELGRRVSAQVTMVDEFLWKQKVAVRCTVDQAVVHGHCHQKALFGVKSLQELLPDTQWIDAGCCGMAGAFGYEHRELSLRIGEDRLFPAVRARAKGAEVIACGFSCRHQIYDACGVMPKHFVEVVKPVDY